MRKCRAAAPRWSTAPIERSSRPRPKRPHSGRFRALGSATLDARTSARSAIPQHLDAELVRHDVHAAVQHTYSLRCLRSPESSELLLAIFLSLSALTASCSLRARCELEKFASRATSRILQPFSDLAKNDSTRDHNGLASRLRCGCAPPAVVRRPRPGPLPLSERVIRRLAAPCPRAPARLWS
jgi:hypothetical protein